VIYLHLRVEDLGQVRFAFSPAWETVISVRTLGTAAETGLHGWWLRAVRPRLSQVDMQLLTAVVRPRGYIPDFLHPFPPRRAPSFEAGVAQIAASEPQLVAAQLAHLAEHPLAQQGPGRQARLALLSQMIANPAAGLSRSWNGTGRSRSRHSGHACGACSMPTSPSASTSLPTAACGNC
jgi:hypothetical protein